MRTIAAAAHLRRARVVQVPGEQDEDRHAQHHAEVVRVARERVDPVDGLLASDLAEHADAALLALPGGQRADHERVEVDAGADLEHQLHDPVDAVHDHPGDERPHAADEERLAAADDVRAGAYEEGEVHRPGDDALHPERERIVVAQVEVPGQVDGSERQHEPEERDRRGRERGVAAGQPVGEERDDERRRDQVRDRQADCRRLPPDLLPGRHDERRKQKPVEPRGSHAGESRVKRCRHRSASGSSRRARSSRRASRRWCGRSRRAPSRPTRQSRSGPGGPAPRAPWGPSWPEATGLPWHRVVTVAGRLVPGHETEHAERLRAEGVRVRDGHVAAPIPWWPRANTVSDPNGALRRW